MVGASSVEGCCVADLVDDEAPCVLGDLGGDCFPLGFVFQVFDLDEFVVVEGLVYVGDGGLADAVSSDLDLGFEAVGLFLEAAHLSGCESVHGGCRVPRFLNWFLFCGMVVVGTPLFLGVSVWGCFRGFLVVWRVFWVCLGVVLVLNSY